MNPATKEEGLKVFLEFLNSQKKDGKGDAQSENLFANLLKKI